MIRRNLLLAVAALVAAVVSFAGAGPARAQSDLQIAPDGKTLVSKDVGGERWAIVRSGDSLTGNVYFPDGSNPQFVSCLELATTGTGEIPYACSGADRCDGAPCGPGQWTPIGEVNLPPSFFEPDGSDAAAALSSPTPPSADAPGSGMQINATETITLVNKDLDDERWAIARFTASGVVTGIVYHGGGSPTQFVWCEQEGIDDGVITLDCSIAGSCRSGPCDPDQWDPIGEVTVPESFFLPPPTRQITPENAASLVLKWDFPIPAGVTASPIVTSDFVYIGGWDAQLYALDPETGDIKWQFDTGVGGLGIQSTVALLPDGDILFGDWLSNAYRLDGRTGALRWKTLVGDPSVDQIWSGVSFADGRVFVGIASHSDNPCTNGRTVALSLESGEPLWVRENVPDFICRTDTSVTCDSSSDCPDNGECVAGRGAGVTATPLPDEEGRWLYVNSVGCYTFPSIGDSDSIMKLDARTGETRWLNRVQPPEQFGYCDGDPSIECGTDAVCGNAGPCKTKGAYHDFGFLNGPLLLDVDGQRLVVSGSKDGTLYALRERDGRIEWKNEVVPTPVSPGFAGFGLFNGGLGYEDGMIYAALFQVIPMPPGVPRLQAFDARDGSTVWTAEIPAAYANVGVKNGVLFTGTNSVDELYVYDAKQGTRLATLELPAPSSSRPTIVGDTVFVGYGIISDVGGVRAYTLP